MKLKLIFLAIILTISVPCLSQENSNTQKDSFDNDLIKCINYSINKDFYKIDTSKSIDYFKAVKSLEVYFLDSKIINDTSKRSYYKLINYIINSDKETQAKLLKNMDSIFNAHNFNAITFSSEILSRCPYYIKQNHDNLPMSMSRQIAAMEKLYASDPYSQEYIEKIVIVVSESDFRNIVYRTPVITILHEYLNFNLR